MSLILLFIAGMFLSSLMLMSPRYLLYLLPCYFVAIGAAFNLIPKEIDYKKIAVVAIILIILVSIPYFSSYYTTYCKNDWRGFSQYLSSETQPGDYVVAMPGYMTLPLDYYYDSTADGVHEMEANSATDLEIIEQKRGNATVYYVVTGDIYAANPNGDALNWLTLHTKSVGRTMGINLFRSVLVQGNFFLTNFFLCLPHPNPYIRYTTTYELQKSEVKHCNSRKSPEPDILA